VIVLAVALVALVYLLLKLWFKLIALLLIAMFLTMKAIGVLAVRAIRPRAAR
jgi:hypothetical protein